MNSPWCKGCGARVEWHPRAVGGPVAIDPEPHPDGLLFFNASMKLERGEKGSHPRMCRGHLLSCKHPEKARAPRADVDDRRRGCFRCGAEDHWIADCPEAAA